MGIYDRQNSLFDVDAPDCVTVIGVGGVGAWVALNFALAGTSKLYLYDDDVVEETNLNRTPFRYSQIGMPKVVAVAQLIVERRKNITVIPFKKKVKSIRELDRKSVIIDCRDTKPMKGSVVAGGYDGHSITLHFYPNPKSVWGDNGRAEYTITPSWLVPPQFIANVITLLVCCQEQLQKLTDNGKETVITFSIFQLVDMLKSLISACKDKEVDNNEQAEAEQQE